jgi:hypothetical protein
MTRRLAYALPVSLVCSAAPALAADAVDHAARLIGRPYVWGAEGPSSFDCSGLVQYVYGKTGIELPRRAVSQSREGEPAGRRLQRGDLVFFADDSRRSLVTHVGIYEGAGMMIEASKRAGKVRRDRLNDDYWVERFMFARRLVGDGRGGVIFEPVRDRQSPRRPSARPQDPRRETAIRVIEHVADVLLRRSLP